MDTANMFFLSFEIHEQRTSSITSHHHVGSWEQERTSVFCVSVCAWWCYHCYTRAQTDNWNSFQECVCVCVCVCWIPSLQCNANNNNKFYFSQNEISQMRFIIIIIRKKSKMEFSQCWRSWWKATSRHYSHW